MLGIIQMPAGEGGGRSAILSRHPRDGVPWRGGAGVGGAGTAGREPGEPKSGEKPLFSSPLAQHNPVGTSWAKETPSLWLGWSGPGEGPGRLEVLPGLVAAPSGHSGTLTPSCRVSGGLCSRGHGAQRGVR